MSGWDRGESKRDYMTLCHQTLSRAQLNAVGKLREAGIITRNLVVLPNASNISLAANGTHVTLSSARLGAAAQDPAFGPAGEKLVGDLAIKIIEHFLPLFVGTYSAAPYRLAHADFHPERALGFLPHQLDYTHLRMIWRRWKGKADIRVFGRPCCPWGPEPLDRLFAKIFRLRGDFVPDFRLLDYLVAPLGTAGAPALDGSLGNEERLLRDLDRLGVFDARMSLYSLFRMRAQAKFGFSGFEGRHYSLFESYRSDMAGAVGLQALVSAFAYRLIAAGRISHRDIPDDPAIESERRQVVFGAAIGIPTFFVDADTSNSLLLHVVRRARRTRASRRYPGKLRVRVEDYRRALLDWLEQEASDLVEALSARETIADLRARLAGPEDCSAAGKLTRGICREAGGGHPMRLDAEEFNLAAERYYRGELRRRHVVEALDFLEQDLAGIARVPSAEVREGLRAVLRERPAADYLRSIRDDLTADRLPLAETRRMIHLMLVAEHAEAGI